MTTTRDWDAASYDRVSAPQLEWGAEVLARLPLRGSETVLDAGCGSGRVTELLVDRLPKGRVIAVDGSAAMVETTRRKLGRSVEVICSDLLDLELDTQVDAVISTATFHWIDDHELLFRRLAAVLREGGRIEAQCGGAGNVAEFVAVGRELGSNEAYAEHLEGFENLWNFVSPAETEARLTQAGFTDVSCRLEEKLARPPSPREFVATVGCGAHLAALPPGLHERFLDELMERLPDPFELRYVRLNISARKASSDPAPMTRPAFERE